MSDYIRQQSPWLAASQAGNALSELPLRIFQLKLQAAQMRNSLDAQNQGLDIQRQRLGRQGEVDKARMALMGGQLGLANAKATNQEMLTGNAEDTGLAALFQTLGVNPETGGTMSATPENQGKVALAQVIKGLMQSASSSPTAAAGLLQPRNVGMGQDSINALGQTLHEGTAPPLKLNANSGAFDPNTGLPIAFGPAVTSGNALYTQQPGDVVSNPTAIKELRPNDLSAMVNGLSTATSRTKAAGDANWNTSYSQDPIYQSQTNLLAQVMKLIGERLQGGGTNGIGIVPMNAIPQTGTTNRIRRYNPATGRIE